MANSAEVMKALRSLIVKKPAAAKKKKPVVKAAADDEDEEFGYAVPSKPLPKKVAAK